jgi:hypothetical protein
MNFSWQIGVVIAGMGIMMILFWVVFAVVVRYLISVFRLIRQVKTAEPTLWESLGRPTMFPMFHASFNPFQGLISQGRFCGSFLKGGEGATLPETKELLHKTRRLFRMGMIGFVSLFVLFIVFFALTACMIGMKGTAQPATAPYSEPAARSPQG